ncbi:MAG: hypothetical protein BWK79_01495 [Beggiatoa sp. IS2]|nr:MAG: hypothetical protein BWK79_01495 [Beggiatoa sp. IS2]
MRYFILLLTVLLPITTFASSGSGFSEKADNNLHDTQSLQRGAKLFVNYCLGCHSAEYVRYQRVGTDLGISDELLKSNLMFNTEKVGEPMKSSMTKKDAKKWFGVVPPDLSVIARARGADWLYNYFTKFYLDGSRPWGVNNIVFKDVGMPHVLWELQGLQKLSHKTVEHEGQTHDETVLEVEKGNLKDDEYAQKGKEYKRATRDLVNFLDYIGEPVKQYRQGLGWKVVLFLIIFLIVSYLLKKEYWRDVH